MSEYIIPETIIDLKLVKHLIHRFNSLLLGEYADAPTVFLTLILTKVGTRSYYEAFEYE
jgi:hypothetical protein